MSRFYRMDLSVLEHNPIKLPEIQEAIEEEWGFSDLAAFPDGSIRASGEDSLCGGESEEEFSERLAKAIFKANGRPCKINLLATYLEELPCEEFSFGPKEYDRMFAGEK